MSRLVYSTGPGGRKDQRRRSGAGATGPVRSATPADQRVRVRRERAGRKGKTVTVAGPFALTPEDAKALLKELKRACGGGGTCKVEDGACVLELQGDHADAVVEALVARGYPAKRSGG